MFVLVLEMFFAISSGLGVMRNKSDCLLLETGNDSSVLFSIPKLERCKFSYKRWRGHLV